MLYVLFLCFPRTCETIVNAFRCYRIDDGRMYLIEDFNIACDSAYQALMFPSASVALAAYAVGVPAVFFWRLHMHREVLSAAAPRWQLGFLYRDYVERYYYFECVELVRKFLLCGCLRFIEPGSTSQIVVGVM